MGPRFVKYFVYSGGIAAILALLYYSYYFSVQVPGGFVFDFVFFFEAIKPPPKCGIECR